MGNGQAAIALPLHWFDLGRFGVEVARVLRPGGLTDTNLPFKSADIRFNLTGDSDNTSVTVSPLYELKYGELGKILVTLMVRFAYRKGMKDLLRGLKQHVETRASHPDRW